MGGFGKACDNSGSDNHSQAFSDVFGGNAITSYHDHITRIVRDRTTGKRMEMTSDIASKTTRDATSCHIRRTSPFLLGTFAFYPVVNRSTGAPLKWFGPSKQTCWGVNHTMTPLNTKVASTSAVQQMSSRCQQILANQIRFDGLFCRCSVIYAGLH